MIIKNIKNWKRLFILIISLLLSLGSHAQSNYASIQVDNLSDAKIREMMDRASAMGYSDAQLEQMASSQGMGAVEIQKLKLRIEKIRKQDANSSLSSGNNTASTNSVDRTRTPDSSALQVKREADVLFDDLKPKIFGSDLFKNSAMTFEPNLRLATPKSYIIGPDDELIIDLSGDNEASYKLKVSPDGTIRIQYVGTVSVAGLSIDQSTSKIRSAMAQVYPGLKSGSTQVAINLGNIRSIKVTILGEVVKPGSYSVSSLSTVFNLLYLSGGPNQNGSFRNIQVIRGDKVVATIDVYNFLLNGIQKNNIRLQDQDVINIPVYNTRVEVAGEIKRPGIFELIKNESLTDLMRFAGGFSAVAYSAQVKVLKNTNRERKISDVSENDFATYLPTNGDKYVVEAILDRFANRVEISGAVFRPGQYELESGLTLKALIGKAEGITEDAFMNRGYISRLNADNTMALVSFDVAKILNGSEPDIKLQREDRVSISSLLDLRENYQVTIQGEVRSPGVYPYADKMDLESLVQMADGLKEGATPTRIEVSRRIKDSDARSASARTAEVFTIDINKDLKITDTSFVLKPFDIVSIRSSESYHVQRQVKVEGEILHPGIYTLVSKDERISDIIKRAGGLSPLAYVDGASLRRGTLESTALDSVERQREERERVLDLQRLKQSGVGDSVLTANDMALVRSNLVGIDLARILKKPASRYDLILEEGDVVRIPKELQTVRVTGQVLKPNSIIYTKNRSFRSYVDGSGGFSYNAYKKGAYIVYSNGSVAAAKKFLFFNNYPQVKPGSEIFIPKRAEREKLGVQGVIGISTALASLAAIILTLVR